MATTSGMSASYSINLGIGASASMGGAAPAQAPATATATATASAHPPSTAADTGSIGSSAESSVSFALAATQTPDPALMDTQLPSAQHHAAASQSASVMSTAGTYHLQLEETQQPATARETQQPTDHAVEGGLGIDMRGGEGVAIAAAAAAAAPTGSGVVEGVDCVDESMSEYETDDAAEEEEEEGGNTFAEWGLDDTQSPTKKSPVKKKKKKKIKKQKQTTITTAPSTDVGHHRSSSSSKVGTGKGPISAHSTAGSPLPLAARLALRAPALLTKVTHASDGACRVGLQAAVPVWAGKGEEEDPYGGATQHAGGNEREQEEDPYAGATQHGGGNERGTQAVEPDTQDMEMDSPAHGAPSRSSSSPTRVIWDLETLDGDADDQDNNYDADTQEGSISPPPRGRAGGSASPPPSTLSKGMGKGKVRGKVRSGGSASAVAAADDALAAAAAVPQANLTAQGVVEQIVKEVDVGRGSDVKMKRKVKNTTARAATATDLDGVDVDLGEEGDGEEGGAAAAVPKQHGLGAAAAYIVIRCTMAGSGAETYTCSCVLRHVDGHLASSACDCPVQARQCKHIACMLLLYVDAPHAYHTPIPGGGVAADGAGAGGASTSSGRAAGAGAGAQPAVGASLFGNNGIAINLAKHHPKHKAARQLPAILQTAAKKGKAAAAAAAAATASATGGADDADEAGSADNDPSAADRKRRSAAGVGKAGSKRAKQHMDAAGAGAASGGGAKVTEGQFTILAKALLHARQIEIPVQRTGGAGGAGASASAGTSTDDVVAGKVKGKGKGKGKGPARPSTHTSTADEGGAASDDGQAGGGVGEGVRRPAPASGANQLLDDLMDRMLGGGPLTQAQALSPDRSRARKKSESPEKSAKANAIDSMWDKFI
jgi:hypothetical protein